MFTYGRTDRRRTDARLIAISPNLLVGGLKYKGEEFRKIADGVMALIPCIPSDFDSYLFKDYLTVQCFRTKGTQFSLYKNSKGHNFVKHLGGVSILFLCTSCDSDLYLYKVS